MDREEIIHKFETLRRWKIGKETAPHKPLLVLYAIRRLRQEGIRLIPYSEVDIDLGKLLEKFGFTQTTQGTEHPFGRLQNDKIGDDGVWKVVDVNQKKPNLGKSPSRRNLLDCKASGGFHEAIVEYLQNDSKFASKIIQIMLDHIPDFSDKEILRAIGIELPLQIAESSKTPPTG